MPAFDPNAYAERNSVDRLPRLDLLGLHAALVAAAIAVAATASWPLLLLLLVLWPAIAALHHGALAQLHEAVHRQLVRSRALNEALGVAIGTWSLTPMSVYRYVHARHHAHLCDEHDPEFWPYNLPDASRARRRAYAAAELLFGFVVTPMLYTLRTLRAWPRHARRTRRRLVFELALLAGCWGAALTVVAACGWWLPFAAAVLVPGWLTGVLQTLRKFGEHLGLAGDSILTTTRSVVYDGAFGRLLSSTQLHVERHATHHRWPRIPYRNLPAATDDLRANGPGGRFYPSHARAVGEALHHLRDPRVGRQWVAAGRGAGMQQVAPDGERAS